MAKLRVCDRNGQRSRLEVSRSLGCGRGSLFMGTRESDDSLGRLLPTRERAADAYLCASL